MSIESSITEAHDNFVNGRFQNAARLLQGPINDLCERKAIKEFLDAVYLSYFRTVALERAGNELELVSTLINMSESLRQFAAKRCLHNIEQPHMDPKSKLHFMNQARDIFQKDGMDQPAESMRKSIISHLQELIPDAGEPQQLEYLKQLIAICQPEDPQYDTTRTSILTMLTTKAQTLHTYNERERTTGGIPKDGEECLTHLELADMYRKDNPELMKSHLHLAYDISPKHLPKYNFPEFQSSDAIDSYSEPSL